MDTDVQNNNTILVILCSLFIGFLLGFLSIYIYTKSKIFNVLSEEKDNYKNKLKNSGERYLFSYIGLVRVLHESKNHKKNEIGQLNKTIINLKNESNSKKNKFQSRDSNFSQNAQEFTNIEEHELSKEDAPNNVIEWKGDELLYPTNIIYFSIPEEDGSFKVVNGKNTKEIDCFYKIEVDKNNQKGKLFFISSEFDLRALDNIDYYLNPVCEIENISERIHARRIMLLSSGTVILNGDIWKIDMDKKIKIKLI